MSEKESKPLTPKEYADQLRVDPRTVYRWLSKHPDKHKAEKIEGGWRIYADHRLASS